MKQPLRIKYVTSYLDRHGRRWWRFRRKGFQEAQTSLQLGTVAWSEWYAAACASKAPAIGSDRTVPGTINDLIVRYYQSTEFSQLRPSTRSTYRGELERFRQAHGSKPIARLEPKHVRGLMDAKKDTPEAANNLRRVLRIIFAFAVERGLCGQNPMTGIKKVKVAGDGFHAWTEDEIATFEKRWPTGTRQRLAMSLLLYTGQRRSDVVRMGRQHLSGNGIKVTQEKTGTSLWLPITKELQSAMDAMPKTQLTFLLTEHGKPFSAAGFGNWFRSACDAAGLKDCSAHGLRKSCAIRMAMNGRSAHEIQSITGHQSLKEVERYTKQADQVRLAARAVSGLSRSDQEQKLSNRPARLDKIAEKHNKNNGLKVVWRPGRDSNP